MAKKDQGHIRRLKLENIKKVPQLQPRAMFDAERIGQYAEAAQAGAKFPPLVCYDDGEAIWLTQGFHRIIAYAAAGIEEAECIVRRGTFQEAQWDAAGSNLENDQAGLYRSNADKRRAVLIALEAYPELSDYKIAEHVGVSDSLVLKMRGNHFPKVLPTRSGSGLAKAAGVTARSKQKSSEAQEEVHVPEEMQAWLREHFCETHKAFLRRFFSDATPERFVAGFSRFAKTEGLT